MKLSPLQKLAIATTLLFCAAKAFAAPAAAPAATPVSFTVEVSGQGKPMILIPGLASSGEVWKDTAAHYAGQYQTHVLTLNGFAGNAPVDGPLLAQVEKDLAAYIDEKKLDHPVVIGHSLGGYLGMQLAADYPNKVGKLVIVDSLPAFGAIQAPQMTAEQLKGMAAQFRAGMLAQDATTFNARQRMSIAAMVSKPDDVERVVGWGLKSDRPTVINAMHDMLANDMREAVARIKAPTLVLAAWTPERGEGSRPIIESAYAAQYQKLPGVKIALAQNAKHFIMYDDPAWMFAQVDSFLK